MFPGATVFSTRRVHKRQFLLKPSAIVNQIILYAAAVRGPRWPTAPADGSAQRAETSRAMNWSIWDSTDREASGDMPVPLP